MEGIIVSNYDKYKGPYFFIKGEDGIEYFACINHFVDASQFDQYCMVGNSASFEQQIEVIQDGKHPTARRIILSGDLNPAYAAKMERLKQEAERHRAKEKKKMENLAFQEKKKKQADVRHRFEADHKRYVVQYLKDKEWKTLVRNSKPVQFVDHEEGLEEVSRLKRVCGTPFRLKTATTITVTVSGRNIRQTTLVVKKRVTSSHSRN